MRFRFEWKSLSSQADSSSLDPVLALLAFLLPLLVSLPLLGTDLLVGSQAEYVLGTATLGVISFPGSPLYLLLAKGISLLTPHASEIWRIQFASLCFGAGAAFFVFRIGRRLHFSPSISLAAAWLFFFTPIVWRQALLANDYSFRMMLLSLLLLLSLELLLPSAGLRRTLAAWAWALLCGAMAAQYPGLLPWVAADFTLVLAIGFSKQRTPGRAYLYLLLGVLGGALVPALYLLGRITAPHAYFSLAVLADHAGLGPSAPLSKLLAWQLHYAGTGIQELLAGHHLQSALNHWLQSVAAFARTLPFLPAALVVLGLGLNLRAAILKKASREHFLFDSTTRLFAAIVPLCALTGEAFFVSTPGLGTQLSCALACGLWGMRGLEYCYQILGHSDEQLAKNQRLHPTWFALLIILLAPVFAFLQTYPVLKSQIRRAEDPASTLKTLGFFLQKLPAGSVLLLADDDYPGFYYLQQRLHIRPDLNFVSLSGFWPEKIPKPLTLLQLFSPGEQNHEAVQKKIRLEWMQSLKERIAADRPVFWVRAPGPANALLESLLQSWNCTLAFPIVPVWHTPEKIRRYSFYAVGSRPVMSGLFFPSSSAPFVVDFDRRLRLLSARVVHPEKPATGFSLLTLRLQWQVLRPLPFEKLLLRFWITPASGRGLLALPDGQNLVWKVWRHFGRDYLLNRLAPKSGFMEDQQLAVPADLPAGRYLVYVGIQPVDGTLGPGFRPAEPAYFAESCDFEVSASAAVGSAGSTGASGP